MQARLLISSPQDQWGKETDPPAAPENDFTRGRITSDRSSDLSSPTTALASLFLIQPQKQISSGDRSLCPVCKRQQSPRREIELPLPQPNYIPNLRKSWKESMPSTRGRVKYTPHPTPSIILISPSAAFQGDLALQSLSLKPEAGKGREEGDAFN